jgi:hypothetical protein
MVCLPIMRPLRPELKLIARHKDFAGKLEDFEFRGTYTIVQHLHFFHVSHVTSVGLSKVIDNRLFTKTKIPEFQPKILNK